MSRGFKARMAAALADTAGAAGRQKALSLICPNIQAAREGHPGLAERLRRIKEESLGGLRDLLPQTVASLEANGCRVFLAADAAAARDYIARVAGGLTVKSKSNVGKEIGISDHLTARGVTVVETDLGDRLNQLAGTSASHPLAPAIHLPLSRVREVLSRESGRELPEDVAELVRAARESLRPYLAGAAVGLSGANAIAADTGAVVLMENEGNIRAVTSLPAVHVVVAGITKIVPTLEDAVTVAQAASVFGAGQDLGTYMSVITGPGRPGINADGTVGGQLGPREVHVVLLDNGRSQALARGFGEAFYCINCGGCLNFCPVYRVLGGGFGHRYIGGIGVVQTALTDTLPAAEKAGLWACLSCGNCTAACPARIDTPEMITRLRGGVRTRRPALRLVAGLLRDQARLSRTMLFARRLTGPLWEERPAQRSLRLRLGPAPLRSRLVPAPRVRLAAPEAAGTYSRRAVLYAGCLINTCYPDIAACARRVPARHGVAVEPLRREACCGLPLWNAGDRGGARDLARRNIAALRDTDGAVLTLCPTCADTLRNFYPRWLAADPVYGEQARLLAGRVRDITAFLADDLGLGAVSPPAGADGSPVTYHDPCHLRLGLGVTSQPRRLLRALPSSRFVEMPGADLCCGFGGLVSVGHYRLSAAITAEKLAFLPRGPGTLATACPGCLAALTDGANRMGLETRVRHVVELVDEAGL